VKAESGSTVSLWHAISPAMTREPLGDNARADVCIVGAGVAGITTAYLLAREGKRVIVLDDGPIGGGETGRTTSHLSDALDDGYRDLERFHGADGARLAAQSHRAAIEMIARIVEEEKIECDFARLDGFLFTSEETAEEVLLEELAAALRAGVDVEAVTSVPYAPFGPGTALRFAAQARIHLLKYVAGLVRVIEAAGGQIYTGTHVNSVAGGSPVRVETDRGHVVLASACVVATNSPISDYVITHLKQSPHRTLAIAAEVPSGSVPDALYWEDAKVYKYVRIHPGDGHDWLIVGGEDYKTGQKDDDVERLERLENWMRAQFTMAGPVRHRWSGQVLEPADGLAFIGPNPDGAENVYIITGDSGHGVTHATLGAVLLSDLIAGRENEWTRLYDPKRLSRGTVTDLAKENLNVAVQYAAWLLPGDAPSEDDVPRGEGRVIRHGAKMVAVYRDDAGALHPKSAVCTHLKCIVNWNNLEKSWDCPCHGSRFAPTGEVLNGPAVAGLVDVEVQASE